MMPSTPTYTIGSGSAKRWERDVIGSAHWNSVHGITVRKSFVDESILDSRLEWWRKFYENNEYHSQHSTSQSPKWQATSPYTSVFVAQQTFETTRSAVGNCSQACPLINTTNHTVGEDNNHKLQVDLYTTFSHLCLSLFSSTDLSLFFCSGHRNLWCALFIFFLPLFDRDWFWKMLIFRPPLLFVFFFFLSYHRNVDVTHFLFRMGVC